MKLPKFGIKNSPKIKKNKNDNGYVVIDLTSTSVKALSFVPQSDGKLMVKGVSVADSYNDKMRREVVENTVKECLIQSNSNAKEAIVGLGGPNVFGFILIAKIKREDSEEQITEKEMDEIYMKIKNVAEEQAAKRWNAHFATESKFEPLDLVVTAIYIDEKVVSEPVGETGEDLKISVFSSYSEKEYYKWAMNMLGQLKFSSLTVTTTMYSQVKLLSEVDKNFILVDVGKDCTEVSVILGKNIIQSRSFDMGGAYFSDYLADKTGSSFIDSNGKKEAYSLNTLNSDESDKIGDYLYDAGKSWRTAFSVVLSTMTGIKSFPHVIYITGGGANMSLLEELLYEDDWRKSIPFAQEIGIKHANYNLLKKHIDDELKILSDLRMFTPASLGLIKLELDEANE